MSRSVSRGCRPIDGSSSTYSVPTSPVPSAVASVMRCASPPESVPNGAVERQVVEARRPSGTRRRRSISDSTFAATGRSVVARAAGRRRKACASRTVSAQTASMSRPPTCTSQRLRPQARCRGSPGRPGSRGSGSGRRGPGPCTSCASSQRKKPTTPWNSSSPSRTRRRCSSGRSDHGTSSGMPRRRANRCSSASSGAVVRLVPGLDRALAPGVRRLSGTTRSWSTSMRLPKPWQVGQAPNGLLNEKSRGCGSSKARPQRAHSKRSEKRSSGPAHHLRARGPLPSAKAVSSESARRAPRVGARRRRGRPARCSGVPGRRRAGSSPRSTASSPAQQAARSPACAGARTRSASGVPPTATGKPTRDARALGQAEQALGGRLRRCPW